MFITENVPHFFKAAALKLHEKDNQIERLAHCSLVLEPFLPWMAHELGEDIAEHLFESSSDNAMPREEVTEITLRVRVGLQRVTVRRHKELDAVAVLADVAVDKLKVVRREDEKNGHVWLAATAVLVVPLVDRAAIDCVVSCFGGEVCLTFESQQRDLLEKADLKDTMARMVPDGTTLTISSEGRSATLTSDDAKRLKREAKSLRQQAGA